MGSATRESFTEAKVQLAAVPTADDLEFADDLFTIVRAIKAVPQLRSLASDPSSEPAERSQVIAAVFGERVSHEALAFAQATVQRRWSTGRELANSLDALGVTVVANHAKSVGSLDRLQNELFELVELIDSNHELALTLGDPQYSVGDLAVFVADLFSSKVSAETSALLGHAVRSSRTGRVTTYLRSAIALVATVAENTIATVTSAKPLTKAELGALTTTLVADYGSALHVNATVDPAIVGGVRVQVGADVIDSTIKTRLDELRAELVG